MQSWPDQSNTTYTCAGCDMFQLLLNLSELLMGQSQRSWVKRWYHGPTSAHTFMTKCRYYYKGSFVQTLLSASSTVKVWLSLIKHNNFSRVRVRSWSWLPDIGSNPGVSSLWSPWLLDQEQRVQAVNATLTYHLIQLILLSCSVFVTLYFAT